MFIGHGIILVNLKCSVGIVEL